MNRQSIAWLFRIAALYDGVLGLAFVLFWRDVFSMMGIPPPNHGAYVTFPGLLLLIFAGLFLQIARDPVRNRDLILYGIALKIAYSGTVFWYQLTSGIPAMWTWFAWADLAFLVLFVIARQSINSSTRGPEFSS